MYQADPDVP